MIDKFFISFCNSCHWGLALKSAAKSNKKLVNQNFAILFLSWMPFVGKWQWYFVTKVVLTYFKKKMFEITRTIYSKSERSEKFLVTECFLNLFLEIRTIRIQLGKKIFGFRNMQETFGNVRKESCSLNLRGHFLINLNDKPFCFVSELCKNIN